MKCSRCGHDNPATQRFCGNCGAPLAAAPERPAAGERKLLTILFADVVGSTAMAEKLDPEEISEIMNGTFALFNAAVAKYGGTVARLMGDAVLAFFGAPAAHEDDAERAVRAGLEMQAAVRAHAQAVGKRYGIDLQARVGINTGLAVLDNVGDQVRSEYTAMGDATNVAARMQSAAEPGTVLISADTYRLVKSLFDFEPRGAIKVKGKSAPIDVYEALSVRAAPGTVRGVEGLSSPLVGRAAEFGTLDARLAELRGGYGSFVAVVGEAGLGKSRLIAELRKSAAPDAGGDARAPLLWFEARAPSYGQSITYYAWKQIVRHALGVQENDSPAHVRAQLRAAYSRYALPAGDIPFVETMLAVASEERLAAAGGTEGEALVRRITEAVRGLVGEALAAQAPTVLVFDDLHWADDASLALLANVADRTSAYPLLIIALLRPDKDAPSWAFLTKLRAALGVRLSEITLEPLPPERSRELLGNLLYIEELPDSVRELILQKSEGNPFFVEEVIRSLIDSRHIVRENSHWRATHEIVSVAIPSTLAGVLAARIDRLPDQTKRVAQMSAVIGRIFAYRVLKAICDEAPAAERIPELMPHLELLTRQEVVRERDAAPSYIFKHALTQEAAYNSLLIKQRKEFHRRVGTALAEIYAGHEDEHAAILAQHFFTGEDWPRAVEFAVRAAEGALRVYALREALEHYQRALDALDRMDAAPPERLIDATLGWVQAAIKLASKDEVIQHLTRAEEVARELGDKRRLARLLAWIANAHFSQGSTSRAAPALFENFKLASELGDDRLSIVPGYYMGLFMVDNDPRAALVQLDQVIELAHKLGNTDIEAHSISVKALAHARLGEFELAKQEAQRALTFNGRRTAPIPAADLYNLAAFAYLDMGDTEHALEYGRHGGEEALAANAIECACAAQLCVGMSQLQRQALPEAQTAFSNSVQLAEFTGAEKFRNLAQGGLALAQFFGGRAEAMQNIEAALVNAQAIDAHFAVALFSRMLGEINTQQGKFAEASDHLARAMEVYRRLGMRPYISRTLQAEARLFEKQNQSAAAEQARAEADALWRTCMASTTGP